MSKNHNIVPWYNTEEWLSVYHNIFSESTNKQVALNLLLVWKARCPFLPSGIESTLCLLQVLLQDQNSNNGINDDQILRLAYSAALMRFVNHTLDTEIAKGVSLYQAAKTLGVPDWIIDLRHDTAHSNNLPSLALLRNACHLSLQWLQHNYWDKHKSCIHDFVCSVEETNSKDDTDAVTLMRYVSYISICKHSKIKKLSDIPDPDMLDYIVECTRQILGNLTNLSNLKTVSIKNLINLLFEHGKKHLKGKNVAAIVNKTLLEEDSIFLSLELVDYLSKKEFQNKHKLSKSYIQCFELLLTFLHTNDLIFDFLVDLIEFTQNKNEPKRSLLAALWVSEILKALKVCKKILEKANRINSDIASNSSQNLKMMYHHWFPNEKIDGITLDLSKPVPNKLTNLNFIQPIVSSYNSYLTYFVHDLLVLVEPKMPDAVIDKICKLAKLISSPDEFPVQLKPRKIYTVDDIDDNNIHQDDNKMNCEEPNIIMSGIWKIASVNYSWATCPIGQMPHHTSKDVQME